MFRQPPTGGPEKGIYAMRALKLLPVVIVVLLLLNSYVIVGPGQRGVVVRLGAVSDRVLGEGLHLRIPFVESVVKMDVRIQKEQTGTAASSKDLQDTHGTVAQLKATEKWNGYMPQVTGTAMPFINLSQPGQ